MKILYGTTNKAKVSIMENATKPLGIELISLLDLKRELPVVDECGKTPLENSKMKAETYYKAFGMPVFSCDSGLYFEELLEGEQPGLHVRRVGGKELTDDEMIEHYASLAAKHGGKLTGRYKNAVYFIVSDTEAYSSMDEALSTEPFMLVTEPHPKRVKGFPLDSLSKDLVSGEYYYDLAEKDVSTSAIEEGYRTFFEQVLQAHQQRMNLGKGLKNDV
ncbi:MAG: hypothetical protein E7253_01285 [Lachnospiraceae bacterium]|nr:hypothetical protein [Lachnospiraceae bacterium]